MINFKKRNIINSKIIIIFFFFFTVNIISCNTIEYYENVKENSSSLLITDITDDGNKIKIYHLEQNGVGWPFHDFEMAISLSFKNDDNFKVENMSFNIYNLNGELIEPFKESIFDEHGSKYYKYSIFFPKKVVEKVEIKFYYNEKYYEYYNEVILTGKRNRTWWSVAQGI